MRLPKFSMGIGDRFAHQGTAQLDAIIEASRQGAVVAPVWNKSHREHTIVGSSPADVRDEADDAVQARGWTGPYFVDADHIGLGTVDGFIESSDFFTLDVGDVEKFTQEFEADLAVIDFAVGRFGLPENLKLSVHSGSDKFSIYGPISRAIKRFDTGVHLKTAGTTWLEELIGLAAAGGDGLAIAKSIYRSAHGRFDELCGPYASVIDINRDGLPSPDEVNRWDETAFASALRHDQSCPAYNQNLRQLLHVGYKVAAELGTQYTDALDKHAAMVAENVGQNILERHIRPLFVE